MHKFGNRFEPDETVETAENKTAATALTDTADELEDNIDFNAII